MSFRDLSSQVAAEFEEAQHLSPLKAEHLWQAEYLESRRKAVSVMVACSCPGCTESLPLYRPHDRWPQDGRRYCSSKCRKKAWRLRNPERSRAQSRAWRRRQIPVVVTDVPVRRQEIRKPDFDLHQQRAMWRMWKR